MLLPSALPCDVFARPSSSYSTAILSPPLTPPQTTTNIHATCAALQSLLAGSTSFSLDAPPRASPSPRRLQSPIAIHSAAAPAPAHTTFQGQRKRRRSSDCESTHIHARPSTPTSSPERDLPSTPKRRCPCPPSLPRGLDRADFAALQSSPPPSRPVPPARRILKPMTLDRKLLPSRNNNPIPRCTSIPPLLPPSPPSPCADPIPSSRPRPWSALNLDPLLLVLVLQKLRLRQPTAAPQIDR